mmetsp:Transcript_2140/g.6339  ORF Transcript_2140/g.6339 Transcript_2140/m.6339 type:complete len:212 (-) Transcript_2140:855-1490(-)
MPVQAPCQPQKPALARPLTSNRNRNRSLAAGPQLEQLNKIIQFYPTGGSIARFPALLILGSVAAPSRAVSRRARTAANRFRRPPADYDNGVAVRYVPGGRPQQPAAAPRRTAQSEQCGQRAQRGLTSGRGGGRLHNPRGDKAGHLGRACREVRRLSLRYQARQQPVVRLCDVRQGKADYPKEAAPCWERYGRHGWHDCFWIRQAAPGTAGR